MVRIGIESASIEIHVSTSGLVDSPAGFEEEPCAPLGFIDPSFDHARGRDVTQPIDNVVNLSETRRQGEVVIAKFREHVERIDIVRVVVNDSLHARDVPDRTQGRAARFASSLRYEISRRV